MDELDMISTPPTSADAAAQIANIIVARTRELAGRIRAVEVTAENYRDPTVRGVIDETAEAVEDIRERGKKLVKAVLEKTDALRVVTQIDPRLYTFSTKQDPDCAYSKLAALVAEKKKQIKAFAEADKPKEPVRTVALVLYATDKGVADLCGKIKAGKVAGVCGYQFAPDEAAEKKAAKIIEAK